MTDEVNASDAGGEADIIALQTPEPAANDDGGTLSVSEAAARVAEARHQREKEQGADQGADDATDEPEESADEADAAPHDEATGEDTKEADPAEQPPLDLPRSWSRDKADIWSKLDRATQEYLLEHDSKASAEVRRSQNEAAEQRKAIEAERQKVEQARQQYEAALPALLQTLQDQQAGEFADVRTVDDVNRLAKEDPFRYLQWDAHQKRMAAVQMEIQNAQNRQAQEKAIKWGEFVQRQNELAIEKIPELADKAKAAALKDAAVEVLREKGFSDQELAELAHGVKNVSIQDHRMQMLIYDAIRWRNAQAASVKAAAKPVPPVQRPGVAQARVSADDAKIQELQRKLDQTGDARIAAELIVARRAAAVRRRA